jgi:hypothetical protein
MANKTNKTVSTFVARYSDPRPRNVVEDWDCDPAKRAGRGKRHKKHQPQQHQQQHQQPLKFDQRYSDAAQDKEYAELVGLKLDQPGATTCPAPKPWETTHDPLVLQKRLIVGRQNDAVLARMRREQAAAAAQRDQALAALAPKDGMRATPEELTAFMHTLANAEARESQTPLPQLVHEFQPAGRSMSLPPYRPPPSEMDRFLASRRDRSQQAPPPTTAAQAELTKVLQTNRLDARNLSQAAYAELLKGLGIG